MNDTLMFINQEGDPVNPASLLQNEQHAGYLVTRPGAGQYGPERELPYRYLDRYRQYKHLHVYPQNLHGDPISLWHYADNVGAGLSLAAMGVAMSSFGVGLCTTGVGCVAGAYLGAGAVGSFTSSYFMLYGFYLELEHQHVIEYRP